MKRWLAAVVFGLTLTGIAQAAIDATDHGVGNHAEDAILAGHREHLDEAVCSFW